MNLTKSEEFFDPTNLTDAIHIIGCGAVGGTIAENLTRMGCTNLHLYDFDSVTAHNVANQVFEDAQIGKDKLNALSEILLRINTGAEPILHTKGWLEDMPIAGYVFLCVDNIDTRRAILQNNLLNQNIIAFFDGRMRLIDAQHYASSWQSDKQKQALLNTMKFTHEEAQEQASVSACGTSLSVVYTVRILCGLMIMNFVKKVLHNALYQTMIINLDTFFIDTFLEKP